MEAVVPDRPPITVYWRRGCAFCVVLRRSLARAGVPTVEVNIAQDPVGAATVRQAAGGNETVPTVDVDGTLLVNPSARQVVEAAARAGIDLPDPPQRRGWRFWRR